LKILVADDDACSRLLIEKTLVRLGYVVLSVQNGHLALEELRRQEGPRLALLDWVMPELDGPGVCREIRKQRDRGYIYILLLTSKESKEDIVAGLQSGADDYLTKPCDASELQARLRTGERILRLEDSLVEAREQMRFKATHDTLTGLWERGVVMDLLGRELARSRRERKCTAILLGDLDYFKSINDSYGHLVGDEVLSHVAKRLVSSTRSYDIVGRYGGEEFLIILPNCESNVAFARAEQIRKAIGGRAIQTMKGPIEVTMSLGLLLSCDWPKQAAAKLLHQVDVVLYSAKAAGRNCVKLAKQHDLAGPVAENPH
jgi:two-component system cell cycle response regulator